MKRIGKAKEACADWREAAALGSPDAMVALDELCHQR